jgi:hypothetical protein
MARNNARAVSKKPHFRSDWNPLSLIDRTGETPSFHFRWKKIGSKRRQIAQRNFAMFNLHNKFIALLHEAIGRMSQQEKSRLTALPSARACRTGDSPLKNALEHTDSEYFYITDFSDAYESLDLEGLAALLMFIFRSEEYRNLGYHLHDLARTTLAFEMVAQDPMFPLWKSFTQLAFGGFAGRGIAFGSNLSPFLFNLYCEVYLDDKLRYYLEKSKDRQHPEKEFVYTRYLDDLVFSRNLPIGEYVRRTIRRAIEDAGFSVNHRKSKVLVRSKGTIFVTKVGLRTLAPLPQDTDEVEIGRSKSVLVLSRKKRRRIEHLIKSHSAVATSTKGMILRWNEHPEKTIGHIAEFIHYLKNVENPTQEDRQTLAKCEEFEELASPHLEKMRWARRETTRQRTIEKEYRTR